MSFPTRSDVRSAAIVLCACLSLLAVLNLGTPGVLDRAGQIKGADFLQFYVLGAVARSDRPAALYDQSIEEQTSVRLVPESRGVRYLPVYGPQVYLFFSPFSKWSYLGALAAWTIVSTLIYAACCVLIWRVCPNLRDEWLTVILVAAGSPAFFNLVIHGQNSAVALTSFTAAYFAIRHAKPYLAGLALGMLVYKPQLGLVVAAVFAAGLEWRVLAGGIAGAVTQLGAAWWHFGTGVMVAYARSTAQIGDMRAQLSVRPYQMHSLLAFWKMLIRSDPLAMSAYALCAVATIVLAVRVWRSGAPLALRYSFLLLATVLVSPHLYVYDLVILAPAALMITDWSLGHPGHHLAVPMRRLLYLSYALPLVGVAAQFTRVQLSVLAMGALGGTVARLALQQDRFPTQPIRDAGAA